MTDLCAFGASLDLPLFCNRVLDIDWRPAPAPVAPPLAGSKRVPSRIRDPEADDLDRLAASLH
jgi:hypothetical protein